MVLFAFVYLFIPILNSVNCLMCGDSIRWVHNMNIEDVYGMWYGVGQAHHNPDMTNGPKQVGCVILYISDAFGDPYRNLLIPRSKYSDRSWKTNKSNPWSDRGVTESWLDTEMRSRRKVKRGLYDSKRMRVLWDVDSYTMEQIYVFSLDDPGLWILEQYQPRERKAVEYGSEYWRSNDYPKHSEAIRILRINPDLLVINHCSNTSDGILTLILKRKPSKMEKWPWLYYRHQFYEWGLPKMYRHSAVCAGSVGKVSITFLIICILLQKVLLL